MAALSPSDLDAIPRLGWVQEPTPVTSVPALAGELGLEFLGIKRDDLLPQLHGGSKPRKLDYLLAAPPFAEAPVWSAMGGIGSGQLVALTAAADTMGRKLHAYVFWTTVSAGVVDNLAFTASGPTEIFFHASRVSLALRRPWLFGAWPAGGRAVVPPGATSPLGMVGIVRAGLELGLQIRAGEVPVPDRVYVALGSGGTAAGLSVGLGLAGVPTTVAAIAVVERVLATRVRLSGLQRQVMDVLRRAGVPLVPPVPLLIDHAHLGRGYAEPTKASLAACEAARAAGIDLEPVYTGKALAALQEVARAQKLRNVIFWSTVRRDPIPHPDGWRARLPPPLARALEDPPAFSKRLGRRRAMIAVGAAVTSTLALRFTGYPPLPGWHGEVLARWEAEVVTAAAEALLAPDATPEEIGEVAARVDRYLTTMPVEVQREVHGLMALVEHGTPLGLDLNRFTKLDRAAREAYLAGLAGKGVLLAQVYGGLRDLVMLGYYQQPATFAAIGYEGPRLPLTYDPRGPERWQWPVYDAMVAPAGAVPRAAAR